MLHSRKFKLMLVDVIVSIATYFIGKYVVPVIGNDILWLIGVVQPVVIALIVGIAVEDAAEKRNPAYFTDCSDTVMGTDE